MLGLVSVWCELFCSGCDSGVRAEPEGWRQLWEGPGLRAGGGPSGAGWFRHLGFVISVRGEGGPRSQYFTEGAWREQLMGTLCGQREDQPGHLANMKITKMSRQAVTRPRSHPRLLSLPFPEGLRGAGAPTPVPAILGVVGGQRWCGVACCPPGAQSTPSLKTGWFFKSCSEVAVPVEGGRGATAGSAFCI